MKYLICLFSIFLFFSCGVPKLNESEPNNTFKLAGNFPVPGEILGQLDSTNDTDIYKIHPEKDQVVFLDLTAETKSDYVVSLFNQYKNEIKTFQTARKEKIIHIPSFFFPAADSYLMIKTLDNSGGKALSYRLTSGILKKIFEQEANDSQKDATALVPNTSCYGHYYPGLNLHGAADLLEKDWFKITNPASGEKNILSFDISGVNGIDAVLEIYSISGTPIVCIDRAGTGGGEYIKNLLFDAPEIYACIFAKSNRVSLQEYQIINEVLPYDASYEWEMNDSISRAVPLEENRDNIKGAIAFPEDIDMYSVKNNFPDGSLLNIAVFPPENIDISLELLNDMGEVIYTSDAHGVGINEQIHNLLVYSENYIIKLRAQSNTFNSGEDYIVKRFYRKYFPGLEKEPNDSPEKSTHINLDTLNSGYISHKNDIDFYAFNAYNTGMYQIHISALKRVDIDAEILDQEGHSILSTNSGISQSVKTQIELDKGTYLVKLSAGKDSGNNPDDIYRIKVNYE